MGKICSITGHRLHTIGLPHDENGLALLGLKNEMQAEIDRLIQECDVTRFALGAAIGTDIWAAEMILKRMESNPKLELELVIPFVGQTEKWNNKSLLKYRERYDAILTSGKSITEYTPDEEYDSKTSYQRRNQYLADKCDYLLAIWNGKNSGTSMTYHMAEKAGKICIVIDPRKYKQLVNTEK